MAVTGLAKGQAGVGKKRQLRPFWQKQFGETATPAQRRFDVAFGILLPVMCFAFDPFVFRGRVGGGLLSSFQFYAYGFSLIEVCALGVWLVYGRRLGEWRPAVAGVLMAGAFFSVTVGVLILPFSLIGLLFLIGALGFTPFPTALVYARNGARAWAHAQRVGEGRAGVAAALVCGAVFALAAPAGAQWGVTRVVNDSLAGVADGAEPSPAAVLVLRVAGAFLDESFDRLVWDYNRETDPTRRARLAKAYRELTGGDIERRLVRLLD